MTATRRELEHALDSVMRRIPPRDASALRPRYNEVVIAVNGDLGSLERTASIVFQTVLGNEEHHGMRLVKVGASLDPVLTSMGFDLRVVGETFVPTPGTFTSRKGHAPQ